MSASLAILTIGVVPMCEVLPLLTEYIDKQHITHHSLLGQMRREDVMAEYGVSPGDEPLLTLLSDHQLAHVSRQKVERSLQSIVEVLDNQGFDVILLMSTASIARLTARNSILLEPLRIIPPLLQTPPVYAVANPIEGTEQQLIDAGKELLEQGADVIMLDCLGFNQRHRDLLQKSLDVPILLSNVLIARLASELLA